MANVWLVSFDFYNTAGSQVYFLQYTGQYGIDLTGTRSRTGIGCCVIDSGAFGPVLAITAPLSEFYWGQAVHANQLVDNAVIANFGLANLLPPNVITRNVALAFMGDGSIAVRNGSAIIAQSAAGLVQVNTYVYVEFHCVINAATGSGEVRLNGVQVLTFTNKNTASSGTASCSGVQLIGAGGGATYIHDDVYLNDTTGTANVGFMGPVQLYSGVPIADETPLQWAPSTGVTHYTMVDDVPQQIATYVADATVGHADAYEYSFPQAVGYTIPAVQHDLYADLDSGGAGAVGSSVNGAAPATSKALSTSPQFLQGHYDTNPNTGVSWQPGDFATTWFGPRVTV